MKNRIRITWADCLVIVVAVLVITLSLWAGAQEPPTVFPNDVSTQPAWEKWPWYDQFEVEESIMIGPIVKGQEGTQQYLAFAPEEAPMSMWSGPKDCTGGSQSEFVCIGKFM